MKDKVKISIAVCFILAVFGYLGFHSTAADAQHSSEPAETEGVKRNDDSAINKQASEITQTKVKSSADNTMRSEKSPAIKNSPTHAVTGVNAEADEGSEGLDE